MPMSGSRVSRRSGVDEDSEDFDVTDFYIGPPLTLENSTSGNRSDNFEAPRSQHKTQWRARVTPGLRNNGKTLSATDSSQDTHCQMDDYIALGSIRLKQFCRGDDATDAWVMIGTDCSHSYPSPAIQLGKKRQWIRVEFIQHCTNDQAASLRIYTLPEDIDRSVRGSVKDFRKVVKDLLDYVDTSLETWIGTYDPNTPIASYKAPASAEEESLFYVFNTLSSPQPSMDGDRGDSYSQDAAYNIFHNDIPGMRTDLYPYQRRSAAAMLQKEASPMHLNDPRKPQYLDVLKRPFYLDMLSGILTSSPHLYSEPRGGILAETMGYGKTLICIALILATRGHYPKPPEGRLDTTIRPQNGKVPSLLSLAARKVKESGRPWKAEFAALEREGESYDRCLEEIHKHDAVYAEPIFNPTTPNRRVSQRECFRTLRLCYTTLVIVPPNLLVQWQHEIDKHTEPGALDVLTLDSSTKEIPHYKTLMQNDIVLISKARFEQEYRDDDLHQGKRQRGEAKYRSQLSEVRWLRVICDEGHNFAGSNYKTHAMAMLNNLSIERRWVVSGTPSSSLHGIEVNIATDEIDDGHQGSRRGSITLALEDRRISDAASQEIKDMERLRTIVVNFLKVQPWANTQGDRADWKKYLAPFDHQGRRRLAPGLRTVLQSLMIRHRIEDIDTDLCLPPLYNKTTLLEPSYHDKLSLNMFMLVLASNAITSERVDEDYMFHPKNRKALDTLIGNLRQSSFHWVGFTEQDIEQALHVSNVYFDENPDRISGPDSRLLIEAITNGLRALADPGWKAFSQLHEIGVWVEGFPENAAEAWAIHGRHTTPLLLGTVQAREAQRYVLRHMDEEDPASGLTGEGLRAMRAAHQRAEEERDTKTSSSASNSSKVPPAGTSEEPKIKNQNTSSSPIDGSPKKRRQSVTDPGGDADCLLARTSPLRRTRVLGFTSAKLTYLCSQVLQLQATEKIIIFYDSNNIAFWIAEAFELLGIKFLIYANTLSVARRATYLATFNQSENFRVLLMDLKQASHGLHIACASRVFIISPIWQPGVESQAIKRAHRIGQTKPVYVETLVLRGTLEEKMLKRRRQMTNAELVAAEKSLLDDQPMNEIIRNEGFQKIEAGAEEVISSLDVPQALFGGTGRGDDDVDKEGELIMAAGDQPMAKKRKKDRGKDRAVTFGEFSDADSTTTSAASTPQLPPSTVLVAFNPSRLHPKPKKSVRIMIEV